MPSGTRQMTTFKKDPMHKPNSPKRMIVNATPAISAKALLV